MAFPTANKKEGNTKSVGVNPCQFACSKGEKVVAPFPGVFTIIIKQIVIPLNTSRAVKRWLAAVILKVVEEKQIREFNWKNVFLKISYQEIMYR